MNKANLLPEPRLQVCGPSAAVYHLGNGSVQEALKLPLGVPRDPEIQHPSAGRLMAAYSDQGDA